MKKIFCSILIVINLISCSKSSVLNNLPPSLPIDPAYSIILEGGGAKLKIGQTLQLHVKSTDASGATSLEDNKTWTYQINGTVVSDNYSNGTSLVSIQSNNSVSLTGVSIGQLTVVATLADSNGAKVKVATGTITVVSPIFFTLTFTKPVAPSHNETPGTVRLVFSNNPSVGEGFTINPAYGSQQSTDPLFIAEVANSEKRFIFTADPVANASDGTSMGGPTLGSITIGTTLVETLKNAVDSINYYYNIGIINAQPGLVFSNCSQHADVTGPNQFTLNSGLNQTCNNINVANYQVAVSDAANVFYQTLGSISVLDIDSEFHMTNYSGLSVTGMDIHLQDYIVAGTGSLHGTLNLHERPGAQFVLTGDINQDTALIAKDMNAVALVFSNSQNQPMPLWIFTATGNVITGEKTFGVDGTSHGKLSVEIYSPLNGVVLNKSVWPL